VVAVQSIQEPGLAGAGDSGKTLVGGDVGGHDLVAPAGLLLEGGQLLRVAARGLDPATESTYDDLGREATLSQVVRQTSHTTTTAPAAVYTGTFTYDDAGNRLSVTDPSGQTATATYDAAGEQTSATDALGRTTQYRYDLTGSPTAVVEPGTSAATPGASQITTYDQAEQATGTENLAAGGTKVSSTSVTYDADGNPVQTLDANPGDLPSTAAYNADDELVQQVQPTSATHSITTGYGYDADGHQTAYTDGNRNTTYTTYNTLGLPESVIDPATAAYPNLADRTYTTAYDTAGEPVTVTEPGGVVQSSVYNADGEVTSQIGTGGEAPTPAKALGYDADGRLTSESTPTGTETYTYEDRGGLWSESGPMGTASYTYNNDGQVASKTDSIGATGYTYDAAGELQTLADPQTGATLTYSYYPAGDLKSVNYGTGGPTQNYTYDAQHDLTGDTLTSATGTTEASLNYGYTAAGQISTETSTGVAGAGTSSYTYDQAGRLSSWTNNGATTNYGYDDNGNLTTRGTASASYNARNQLVTAGSTSYNYTARGTLASTTIGGTATMTSTYNAFDQLATQGAQSYTYDSLGRLATANSSTFTYDDTSDNITSDGTESFTRTPTGGLTSIGADGNAAFAYNDPHGDLLGTFTTNGTALAGSTAYDPWGSPTTSTGTQSDLGYQGGWTDPSTDQVNTATRWYNPGTADFTSRDTAPLNVSIHGVIGVRRSLTAGDGP
jgi:RHS repeat-associated protein